MGSVGRWENVGKFGMIQDSMGLLKGLTIFHFGNGFYEALSFGGLLSSQWEVQQYDILMPNSPCLMVPSFFASDKCRKTQKNSQRMMYGAICSYAKGKNVPSQSPRMIPLSTQEKTYRWGVPSFRPLQGPPLSGPVSDNWVISPYFSPVQRLDQQMGPVSGNQNQLAAEWGKGKLFNENSVLSNGTTTRLIQSIGSSFQFNYFILF